MGQKTVEKVSTKAKLLVHLRKSAGKSVSGSLLAKDLGISRVAVWKGMQSLIEAGYPIVTLDSGYSLEAGKADDFLYSWEFGEQESMFRYFEHLSSTMDSAREFALKQEAACVIIAGTQYAGRGRNGRSWASRQGGLFCTILERPNMTIADYCQPLMIYQIAIARMVASICGKPAWLRWPNDVYIGKRKIAGVMTELGGEADSIKWLALGIGVNVNNQLSLEKAVSCAELSGHPVSRREVLLKIIDEVQQLKQQTNSSMVYAQGNRLLADEWNAIADGKGAKAAVIDSHDRVLAKGIYSGVDPAGRCIINSENGKGTLYFNPGPVSVVFLNEK